MKDKNKIEEHELRELRKILKAQHEERLKTLPVVEDDVIKRMEEYWGKIFQLYLECNDKEELRGRKYKGAFARAMNYDLVVGRCLAQRPHAIYNFSKEYKELDDKFSKMIGDIFDKLTEEEKDELI